MHSVMAFPSIVKSLWEVIQGYRFAYASNAPRNNSSYTPDL